MTRTLIDTDRSLLHIMGLWRDKGWRDVRGRLCSPLFALTGFVSVCVGSKVYLLCSSVFASQLKRNTTAPKVCCHSDGKADPHLKKSLPPSITDTGQKQQSVQSIRPARARHHCVNVTHI